MTSTLPLPPGVQIATERDHDVDMICEDFASLYGGTVESIKADVRAADDPRAAWAVVVETVQKLRQWRAVSWERRHAR